MRRLKTGKNKGDLGPMAEDRSGAGSGASGSGQPVQSSMEGVERRLGCRCVPEGRAGEPSLPEPPLKAGPEGRPAAKPDAPPGTQEIGGFWRSRFRTTSRLFSVDPDA